MNPKPALAWCCALALHATAGAATAQPDPLTPVVIVRLWRLHRGAVDR